MADDKIIPMPIRPIQVNVPEGNGFPLPPSPGEGGYLGFTDIEAAFNMRDWLERACVAAGGKQTGAGMGCGAADILVELEGCEYMVSIKPVIK